MVNQALLFSVKTILRKLIDLLPANLIPDVQPQSREGILFNQAMTEIIQGAELNHPDPENFITFAETMRKTILYLMEEDGYYRRYVAMFFDKIARQWKNE